MPTPLINPAAYRAGPWGAAPLQEAHFDPSVAFAYHNDFMHYVSGDWTATAVEAGASSSSVALGDAAGGVLVVTNDAADDDSTQLQKNGESWKLASGKACYFETRVKFSDATQSDILVGLNITDTTLIPGTTDGVTFRKADGSTAVGFYTEKDSTETATASVHTLVADTYVRLGFAFDGAGTVYGYVNGVLVATHTTNIPDDEELTISFAHQNGEAVAKVMTIDYVKVVAVR
jgi:hypothetical protein